MSTSGSDDAATRQLRELAAERMSRRAPPVLPPAPRRIRINRRPNIRRPENVDMLQQLLFLNQLRQDMVGAADTRPDGAFDDTDIPHGVGQDELAAFLQGGGHKPKVAHPSVVASLPRHFIMPDDAPTDPCPVCQEAYEPLLSEIITMPCLHMFHVDCLTPWVRDHNTCPVCRHALATTDDM